MVTGGDCLSFSPPHPAVRQRLTSPRTPTTDFLKLHRLFRGCNRDADDMAEVPSILQLGHPLADKRDCSGVLRAVADPKENEARLRPANSY